MWDEMLIDSHTYKVSCPGSSQFTVAICWFPLHCYFWSLFNTCLCQIFTLCSLTMQQLWHQWLYLLRNPVALHCHSPYPGIAQRVSEHLPGTCHMRIPCRHLWGTQCDCRRHWSGRYVLSCQLDLAPCTRPRRMWVGPEHPHHCSQTCTPTKQTRVSHNHQLCHQTTGIHHWGKVVVMCLAGEERAAVPVLRLLSSQLQWT